LQPIADQSRNVQAALPGEANTRQIKQPHRGEDASFSCKLTRPCQWRNSAISSRYLDYARIRVHARMHGGYRTGICIMRKSRETRDQISCTCRRRRARKRATFDREQIRASQAPIGVTSGADGDDASRRRKVGRSG